MNTWWTGGNQKVTFGTQTQNCRQSDVCCAIISQHNCTKDHWMPLSSCVQFVRLACGCAWVNGTGEKAKLFIGSHYCACTDGVLLCSVIKPLFASTFTVFVSKWRFRGLVGRKGGAKWGQIWSDAQIIHRCRINASIATGPTMAFVPTLLRHVDALDQHPKSSCLHCNVCQRRCANSTAA